jgi:hypothetical protein
MYNYVHLIKETSEAEAPATSALLRGAPIMFREGRFYFKKDSIYSSC